MYKKCAQVVDRMWQNYVQKLPQNSHLKFTTCVKNELSNIYTATITQLGNYFRRFYTSENIKITDDICVLSTLSPQPTTITTIYINNKNYIRRGLI